MSKSISLLALALVLLAFTTAPGYADESPPVRFTSQPQATFENGIVQITFAVSRAVDAEVAVTRGDGKVVRHLAAGLLGDRAPAPFQKGLEQKLAWDGKDDAGTVVVKGRDDLAGLRVRVALGAIPKLHRIYGWSGKYLANLAGMQCGPDGKLYAIQDGEWVGHRSSWMITAFDAAGKYHHQVYPGPAALPAEKRKGWPWVKLADGTEMPIVQHLMSRSLYPAALLSGRNFPAISRDGRLILLSSNGGGVHVDEPDIRGGRRLLTLNVDGSVPENFLGPEVFPQSYGGFGYLALAPDEKHVYVSGLFDQKRGVCHVVWKVRLDGQAKPEIVAGKLFQAGKGKEGLNEPTGLAVDAQGNLYVADYGNDRVAVFRPDGTFQDEIAVTRPDQVQVSKTGGVFVLRIRKRENGTGGPRYYSPAHNWQLEGVTRFDGLGTKKVVAELKATSDKFGGGAFMALDDSRPEPVLYVGGIGWINSAVFRCKQQDGKIELGEQIAGFDQAKRLPAGDVGFTGDIAWADGKLFSAGPSSWGFKGTKWATYSTESGAFAGHLTLPKASPHGELVSGKDGNLYLQAMGVGSEVLRYDAKGKPLPFAGSGKNVLTDLHHGHSRQTGLFVDQRCIIYVPSGSGNREIDPVSIKRIGADGKVLADKGIEVHGARTAGIVADADGNVYLGAQVTSQKQVLPDWIAGRLPKDAITIHAGRAYQQVGSLFRFPPDGGGIVRAADGEFVGNLRNKPAQVALQNVTWNQRAGLIPNKTIGCYCETTRIDIDAYGRVYVPDTLRFSVAVYDSAGNETMRIGAYGNMDSRGPGSPVPSPEISFGWPLSARFGDGKLFVSDLTNCRLVGVRFEYTVALDTPIK